MLFKRKRGARLLQRISSGELRNRFDRRSFVIGSVQGGIGVLLAARMGYLAVAENEKYNLASESNRVDLTLIPPRRGWILDRNNIPMASNRADFRVDLVPERVIDKDRTLAVLGEVLELTPAAITDLRDKLDGTRGFRPVEVATGVGWEQFAALSVRLPDLPGVVPQRGFTRYYPTGPSVGHLLGYVGTVSAEEYEEEKNPLLITPGFKIGKDGVEKYFEQELRGEPGARRAEVTASGKIVRDLETREDVQGDPVKLTINAKLQDYAARRIGLESGSVVVMDLEKGDLLCMASMPSFDPNSFSDGIGRVEWKMLSEDDHVPLRNKVLSGLYPPGSTVKPFVSLALLKAGVDPEETVFCGGGLRVGNRVFGCWNRRGHGTTNMAKGIYQSCDVYFYAMAQRVGMQIISDMARELGLGYKYPLPVASQSYGTVPDPAWKLKKYGQEWQAYDTVNATIGQGYFLVNPLQQAVMTSRIASGRRFQPRLLMTAPARPAPHLDIPDEHLEVVRKAMWDVVNGPGTAGRARLPLDGIELSGKTGTAQVVSLAYGRGGMGVPWKYRDHGHFVCFAPYDKPKYACAVAIEHGAGSSSAYPVARDVMTYLFDPHKALEVLHRYEEEWGGTAQERLSRKYQSYERAYGGGAPKPETGEVENATSQSGDTPAPQPVNAAEQPRSPEGDNQVAATPTPASTPSPAPTPSPTPSPSPSPTFNQPGPRR
ncbi:penicillin-binding protein 2 [Croceicoccus gelatinilyticus]|uniref:penicillin-binding protein 2 n=1 Tax=Croceicoccus gelatinilyticus TaxID=2835536 RepID=UPI001BCD93D2|nr:penicillin-binding protein 2 [Croceicoccus gelatinilyticus]MBS7668861.1 penicillin-binding protein 2 [Croceicoccus gelatinilyticus]